MQIGARLLFAFVAVILLTMFGATACMLVLDYKTSREAASTQVLTALKRIGDDEHGQDDLHRILAANDELAQAILRDPAIIKAFVTPGDRSALGSALKGFLGKTSFSGIATFIDSNWNLYYSTDTPSRFGLSLRDNPAMDQAHQRQKWGGPASLTETGQLTLSEIVPVISQDKDKLIGALAISVPIDSAFLSGLTEKLAISSDHLSNIDLVMIDGSGDIAAITPSLAASDNSYVKELRATRGKALTTGFKIPDWVPGFNAKHGFEAGGRWWALINMKSANGQLLGVMLVTTPVTSFTGRLISLLIVVAGFAAFAFLIALVFSVRIGKSVNQPLRFLIHRTEQIANQKTALPPLEGLNGDWLELGEQIDTAVTAMRSTVQSLRMQVSRLDHDTQERARLSDDATTQLDAMNRQFSMQSKQLNEYNKQLSTSNKQAIHLQHKLDSVLQVSTEGFLMLDQFGNVLTANPVFLGWIGANEAEIAGRLCFDLVKRPGEPPNSIHEGQAFARHGGDPNALINQFYADGVIYHRYQQRAVEVMAHLQPIMSEDEGIQGYIMVLRDKSLRSENAQLRSEIVSMLSDSIRGPITAAESTWAAVLNNAGQTMHPQVNQTLSDLHAHYTRLLGVVDSLLMTYGGFVPPPVVLREPVIITRAVADCLEEVAPLARANQLALDYRSSSALPPLSLNKEGVKATLVNILQRMISFTAPGGRVRVETMLKGSELRIGVQSSGPALPENELSDLFVGFVEGRHDESTYGERLSMYLARNTIERLGGKIWAESEAGRGTIVAFTIPVQIGQ